MSPIDRVLEPVVSRLVAHLSPDAIVLFGSHVTGRPRLGSDIDLLVIGPFLGEAALHLGRARALLAGHLPRIDLVLARAEDIERSPFLRSVTRTGRLLWQRAPDSR